MFDEELDKYDTYEEYLDSLVSEEDHKYLQDEEMARAIAELGYRSSGDTLTRENFYKLKGKLAEARLLTMQRRNSDSTNNVFEDASKQDSQHSSVDSEDQPQQPPRSSVSASRPLSTSSSRKSATNGIVRAIRTRIQAIRAGELLSILFIRYAITHARISVDERPRFILLLLGGQIKVSYVFLTIVDFFQRKI